MFQYCDVPKLVVVSPIFQCSNLLMFKCKSTQCIAMMFQWLLSPTATPGSGQPITGPSCSQQRRKVIAITSQDLHPACALIWASMTSRCRTNCQQKPMPITAEQGKHLNPNHTNWGLMSPNRIYCCPSVGLPQFRAQI